MVDRFELLGSEEGCWVSRHDGKEGIVFGLADFGDGELGGGLTDGFFKVFEVSEHALFVIFGGFDDVALAWIFVEESVESGAGFNCSVVFCLGVALGTTECMEGLFPQWNQIDWSSKEGSRNDE